MAHALFKDTMLVNAYSEFRPRYGQEVVDHILQQMEKVSGLKPKYQLMVEVGCGGGQATNVFAPYFNKVLASDISEDQIKEAKRQNQHQHVTYSIGKAEDIKVADGSVDLLLAAEAAHWFNLEKFFAEVSRVLIKGGVVALMGYSSPIVFPIINEEHWNKHGAFVQNLFTETLLFKDEYVGKRRECLVLKYENIYEKIPSDKKKRFSVKQTKQNWTLATAKGFIRSMSMYPLYMESKRKEIFETKGNVTKEDMRDVDLAEIFGETVKQKLGVPTLSDEDLRLTVQYEYFVLSASNLKILI